MAGPQKLVDAFAHAAASPQITNPIPETTSTPGAASFALGFPPDTMQNPAAGGIPPFGQDFNGILFMITSIIAFLNQGNTFQFDGAFATSIGGYAQGSIVQSARTDLPGSGYWLNTVAANHNDPDASTNSGWIPFNNYGSTSVAVTTGTVTLSAKQAARSTLVFTGTLTGNVQVVLPNWQNNWLVINNCTVGSFTLTVKTAAGTGVVVPAGGFSAPTGIYGDGTNIYNSFSPLTVPISQAATPLTLAERTNLGYLLATYFNQSSGLENPTIGAVFVQNTAADGYLRKISLANFVAQLPSLIVTRSVSGAETTYSIAGGAIIVKVGIVAQTVATNQSHNFAVPFPNSCDGIDTCVADSTGVEFFGLVSSGTSRTGFEQYSNNTCNVSYIAIGH